MTDPGRLVVVAPPPPGIEPSARARAAVAEAAVLVDDDADVASVVADVAGGSVVVLRTSGASAGLVGAVVDAGLLVEVVPAAVAPVAALVASGLATDHVAVEPALPPAGPAREARLAALAATRRTTALPVAADDLAATLADVAAACGPDRPLAVAAGVGTAAEQVWRGPASAAGAEALRADVVLVVGGDPEPEAGPDRGDEAVLAALREARSRGLSPGRAAAEVAAALGRPRREVYALGATEDPG